MSSGTDHKCEVLTSEDVLPEKHFLEKAATIKRFEYSPLGSELKKQIYIAKKQYQRLDMDFNSNKDNKNVNESLIKKEDIAEAVPKKKHNKLDVTYNRLSFYSYNVDKILINLIYGCGGGGCGATPKF